MPAFALSESLEEQLESLAAEVRRLRILRGASWLVALLFAAPLAAIALDATFELSGRARGALLAGWVGLAAVAAWWFVVRRLRETMSPEALAQLIEEKFPSLAERLRTLVELSEHAEAGNGSRTMMALLARETERRTKKLDFHRAAPTALSFRLVGLVAVAALLAFTPLLFLNGSGDRVRRLLVPWHMPPVEQQYEVVVSSGDPVVKRGQSITLSGYLKKSQPNAVLPDSAAVLFREAGSTEEKKLPMVGDDKSAFTLTRPSVASDLEYCIESGTARSEWHTISAVDPVEVAAGSEVAITPPAYAAVQRPKQTLPTLTDLEALQHSKAELKVNLNRKAQAVQLEWRPADAKATAPVERLTVQLDESRTSASAEIPLKIDGTLKWILFAEKDVRTEIAQVVRVIPDAAPKFEKVSGFPAQARDIRPTEELRIDLAATDDVAITQVFLEYGPAEALDDSQVKSEPVNVAGLGTARIEGQVKFRLPTNTVEGHAYRVRLRILDNRSIPELDLKPQQATYPENGWAILRVSTTARPLVEQETVAKKDRIQIKLDAIQKLLTKAHADLKPRRLEFQAQPKLALDHSVKITEDLDAVREALSLLEELARETTAPELRTVGNLAQELADGDVRTAEIQLKRVLNEADATPRDTAALSAQHALEAALLKLAALQKMSEAATKNWLEQTQLNQLARDQEKLAEEAKTAKTPTELAAEQKKLKEELDKLIQQSDTLKKGGEDAEAQRRQKEADELRKLAQEQKDLDAAIRKSEAEANKDQLDLLAKKQKELADKTKKLAEKTELAARLAQTAPLEQKPSQNATDLLEKKKPIEALTEQEKAARDLDRLADSLEKSAIDRSDSKKAAQQLARWQEDLQRRINDGLKQTPRGDTPADREKWAEEQKAIQDETRKLQLPPSPALDKTHQQAKDATQSAAEQLKRDPAQAAENLRKATEALNQLAEKTPGQQQRLQAAAQELDKLRKEQDAINKEIDDTLRNAKSPDDPDTKKKLEATAEKQDELKKKIEKLDTPGQEQRRAKAADASQRAQDDLKKGQQKEMAASQQEAKLQLDRLKQSLAGQTPADEQAKELARLQKELTENLAQLEKPTADDLQRLQRSQKEITRQLQQLQAPEAQTPLQDAREAAQAAEAALKKPEPDIDELKKKSQQAKAATQQLADKLNKDEKAQAPAKPDEPTKLPNKKDAAEARELAKEQRELREQLSQLAEKTTKAPQPSKGDPLKELAEKQEQLAKDAEQLAKDAKAADQPDSAAKAEEAAKKAHAAGKKLEVGDEAGARAEAEQAKKKLEEAAKAATKPELAKKADELGKQQGELTDEAKKKGAEPGSGLARQLAKQQELAKESQDLAKKFEQPGSSEKPDQQKASQDAADGLKKAATAMEQANRSSGNNKPGDAAKSRADAADALEKSQKALEGSGGPPQTGPRAEAARDAAKAAQQAQQSMQQAEKDLGKADGPGAGPAMKQAGEQLKQAAKKLGEANGQGDPSQQPTEGTGGANSGAKTGSPDKPTTTSPIPSVVSDNLGKAWGDLPGDVKSKITQELKAKYGDDYARLIKLYFEQLAERK